MKQLEIIFPPGKSLGNVPWSEAELEENARRLFRRLGLESLTKRVRVRWNNRLQTTAGLAYPGSAVVWLNPRLLQFGREEVWRTLLHELAHLVAHARAGRRKISPHGPEWRQACADLGLPGEQRCHDLPLPRRVVERRHTYQCPHCESEIKRVRPIRRTVACYDCCKRYSGGRFDSRFRLDKVRREE